MNNFIGIWLAVIIDTLLGDPYWFPHPVKFIGKYIKLFEKNVRKLTSSKKGLKIGGMFLVITTVALTYIISWGILYFTYKINIWFYWVINIGLMWTCIALKCLATEALKVFKALKSGDIELARKQIGYLVARDTSKLDETRISRATVETVVENTSDGIIAPLFYMFVGGVPLAMAYKSINTMDSMVGYKNDKYINFGFVAAKVDDIVNYIPARLTGLMMVVVAFICRLDYKNAWYILRRDRRNHQSPNAAYPEAAAAGALNVQLGGSNVYFGKVVKKPTIGDLNRNIRTEDIINAIRLMYTVSMVMLILCSFIFKF